MNGLRTRGRWAAVVGGLSLVAVAACTPGGGDGEGGGGEITWAIGGAESAPGGVNRKIVKLWNEQNPDTPVRIEVLPEDADAQREQQALELQAQGSGFDVLGVDVIWTGEYSTNGWLESLEDVRGEIEPEMVSAAFESATWNGELWAAPYNSNAGFLYYRTDLVDQPPETWEEMCDTAIQVSRQQNMDGFIGQGARYEGFVVNWLEFYWSGGGSLYNEDQSEVTFDTQVATKATKFMQQGLNNGCFAPGFNTAQEEEARNEFQSGNAVFMRNWPYAYDLIKQEARPEVANNFDIAPLPTFTGEGTISALGGFNNAVSAYSDNKEAAKEFVVWAATNPKAQEMLATEASVPPVLRSTYEDLQDDPVMALLGEILDDSVPRPPAPQWNAISIEMQRQLFAAYNGDASIPESVQNVQEFLQGTLEGS